MKGLIVQARAPARWVRDSHDAAIEGDPTQDRVFLWANTRDPLAHIFLEVFPNKLNGKIQGDNDPRSPTDPRTVYGLRWIIGRRLNRDFAPPYVLN